jgi:putative sigma-54 modulation protein
MVGVGLDTDLEVAANDALEKLEKQVLKLRSKWRDTKRHKEKGAQAGPLLVETPTPARPAKKAKASASKRASASGARQSGRTKIFRVNHNNGSKPMTLEEAMLEMDDSQDYVVYRDAQTERVQVLMRRPDGHFDLIES